MELEPRKLERCLDFSNFCSVRSSDAGKQFKSKAFPDSEPQVLTFWTKPSHEYRLQRWTLTRTCMIKPWLGKRQTSMKSK
jgi:hypothetical protein